MSHLQKKRRAKYEDNEDEEEYRPEKSKHRGRDEDDESDVGSTDPEDGPAHKKRKEKAGDGRQLAVESTGTAQKIRCKRCARIPRVCFNQTGSSKACFKCAQMRMKCEPGTGDERKSGNVEKSVKVEKRVKVVEPAPECWIAMKTRVIRAVETISEGSCSQLINDT